jgi:hypothetical protein
LGIAPVFALKASSSVAVFGTNGVMRRIHLAVLPQNRKLWIRANLRLNKKRYPN